MELLFQRPLSITDAIVKLADLEMLPTGGSSADIRQWSRDVRAASLFSARTTHLGYLKSIQDVTAKMLSGEINIATGRALLQDELDAIGYTPEGGFPSSPSPGGEGRGEGEPIPPADAGSLRDLSSDMRLKLILETQTSRAQNFALREAGNDDAALFQHPAWELVRLEDREKERDDWPDRFVRAGGTLHDGRMIARKDADVRNTLGDSGLFSDGLDSDTPPYAFSSGMGWREVGRREAIEVGLITGDEAPERSEGRFFEEDGLNLGQYSGDELTLLLEGLRAA